MPSEHVLSIPRTDSPGDYILFNTSSNGPSPLDLKLLATEGTQPYLKNLKHSRIAKYRAKSNHLSESQWESLLRSTLVQEPFPKTDSEAEEDPSQNLELVAYISSTALTITLRKSISGIHQKLGDLSLPASPDTDINVIDWCHTAILRADTLDTQTRTLQQELASQTATVKKLRAQLEDLILAKKEHEEQLLQKCAVLINEKKAKIRDQLRLLKTAKPDPRKVQEAQRVRQVSDNSRRSPKASRSGKRKASRSASGSDNEDEDGGFDVSRDVKVDEDEEEQRDSEEVTPQHSDLDETDDEFSGGDEDAVPTPSTAKGKMLEKPEVNGGPKVLDGLDEDEDVDLPPRRELPFQEEKANGGQATADGGRDGDTNMNDDDDETDDDEL
ncbi:MAG: hypothetical protein Q9201_002925 [Fulgogasparrea decipioides]